MIRLVRNYKLMVKQRFVGETDFSVNFLLLKTKFKSKRADLTIEVESYERYYLVCKNEQKLSLR